MVQLDPSMKIFKNTIKKIKVGKHHLDWIAGLLSIPVLLSVIILNLNNLNSQKKNTSTPTSTEKVIVVPQNNNQASTPKVEPTNASCKKEVGPISITSPKEGATVTDNPACITIKYDSQNFCSVVWSYRINGGGWSEYNSNSPCLYNLPSGDVKFELRVQSAVSQDQETLTRNFIYKNQNPTSTPSANY